MATTSVQTQLALRFLCETVARDLSSRIERDALEDVEVVPEDEEDAPSATNFVDRRYAFMMGGARHPARLVNLPTIVETHKTLDGGAYYKCGDVAQLLLVYRDDAELERDRARTKKACAGEAWRSFHPDGLTPPLKAVVSRRFAKARKRAKVAYAVEMIGSVEREMLEIIKSEGALSEDLTEDIVEFEDWMISGNEPNGVSIADDSPLAQKYPWVLLNAGDAPELAARAQAPSVLDPTPPKPNGAPATTAEIRARRQRCADELNVVTCEIEAYEEQSKSSDASTRHHSQQKLEEYRDKKRRLMVELNKCDEKLLFAQLEEPPEPQAQDPPAHYPNDDVQMTDA